MKLRYKLLFAQLPLAIALVALGMGALSTVSTLGDSSKLILADNYRSVLAMQRLKEAIERIDSGLLFLVAGRREEGLAQIQTHREPFEVELKAQEGNITEPGEGELTKRLREAWTRYQTLLDRFIELPKETMARSYFGDLALIFQEIKKLVDEVLALNQDAMMRKRDLAQRQAGELRGWFELLSSLALLSAVASSIWLTRRLLRPLDRLSQVAHRIGEGDLEVRALVSGGDEIAALAREFNEMTERLSQYRKSTLGELLRTQKVSQAAIDSLPEPVIVLGIDGQVLNANMAGEELLGLSRVPLGQNPLIHTDPALRAAIERALRHVLSGKGPYVPHGFEDAVRIDSPSGERYMLTRANPLYADEGVKGVTVLLQDVTRLRRFDELKNNLVSTVAHEFRTPLTSLHMAIHLCLEEAVGPLTDKQADLLHAARQDCERLQGIVNDLLNLARLQSGNNELHLQAVSPAALVSTAVEAQLSSAHQRGISLATEVTPSLSDVTADADRIQLVFGNLLANAIRYAPSESHIRVRALEDQSMVRFEVNDEGPGIPAEYRDRIFERFFRIPDSPDGGTGLGLSVAKDIVEAHGGEIGFVSDPGHGATFWFTLPVAQDAP